MILTTRTRIYIQFTCFDFISYWHYEEKCIVPFLPRILNNKISEQQDAMVSPRGGVMAASGEMLKSAGDGGM